MKANIIPSVPEVLREAVIVLVGAAIAYVIVNKVLPAQYRKFFSLNGGNTP